MCRSIRGLLLGCLAFSVIYILAGCVQVSVGVVFMFVLPIFRLASNIWTGAANLALGGAMTALISCGRSNLTKNKICLGLSIAVVLINLGNLLVLEICEWRDFIPASRHLDSRREQNIDMLLAAYLTSTISTAVALVIGFVACEYIYCLLIAGAPNEEDEDKPESLKRAFPCRTRRASSYEPISFSWVFEASDNFYSAHGSLIRSHGAGVANKMFNPAELVPELPPRNGVTYTVQSKPPPPTVSYNRPEGAAKNSNSKSSSGYSSPDLLLQQYNNAHNLLKTRNHYENIEFIHLNNRRHFSQDNVAAVKRRLENNARPVVERRGSRSLVQLPSHFALEESGNSPVHQSTLPLREKRKRSMSDVRGRRPESKSPRKRCRDSEYCGFNETTSFFEGPYRRPRLSSTPESYLRQVKLPDVTDISSIDFPHSPIDEELPLKATNASPSSTDTKEESPESFLPTTSNALINPEMYLKPQTISFTSIPSSLAEKKEEKNFEEKEKNPIYQTSISTNGLPIVNVKIHQEPNESQSTWKLFRKPSWKDLEMSKYSSKSDDGVVFRSLDRRLKDKYLESGNCEGCGDEVRRSDSIIRWKPSDQPQLSPFTLDDCDTLVNLSNLELLARLWRMSNFHKRMQRQISAQLERDRSDISLASANNEPVAFTRDY